jgi:hypothetical protein
MTAQIGGTSSTVDLLMANDYDVRRISASIITTTGTTVTLTGGSATDGTGSASSFTYNGAQGVGAPVLTSALTNLVARDSYRSWAAPWMDAATVGTLATSIELQSNGSLTGQKQQILTLCGYSAASVDGALAPACSPDLTQTGPRYAILNAQDVPVAGMEIAARVAAARAGTWIDKPNKNWNGFKIQGSVRAPILLPPSKTSILAQNQALVTYALAPVVRGKSGYMEIVKGRSTSLAVDKRLWAWSSESQAAFHILDLHNRYAERFSEASLVRFSEPKAPGLFDSGAVEFATIEAMKAWELAGHYDGADILAPAVKTTIDPNNPFRFNTEFPESPVLDLDQIVFTSHFSSPGQ